MKSFAVATLYRSLTLTLIKKKIQPLVVSLSLVLGGGVVAFQFSIRNIFTVTTFCSKYDGMCLFQMLPLALFSNNTEHFNAEASRTEHA